MLHNEYFYFWYLKSILMCIQLYLSLDARMTCNRVFLKCGIF